MVYSGTTDAQGYATVEIEQPRGVGLITPLNIAPVNSYIPNTVNYNVIFHHAYQPGCGGGADVGGIWMRLLQSIL